MFANLTATIRGTPRGGLADTRMITIDAPLFPLLIIDKPVKKSLSQITEEGLFNKPTTPAPSAESDEVYNWSSYVRDNFEKPKAKKKDGWKQLEVYSAVSIILC